jgi:hypothetical protein
VAVTTSAPPALPATPGIELPASVVTPLPDLGAVTPDEPAAAVVTPGPGVLAPVTDVVAPVLDDLDAPLP